jgi:hypothetical protein
MPSSLTRALLLSCVFVPGLVPAAFGQVVGANVERRQRCAVKDPSLLEQELIEAVLAAAERSAGASTEASGRVMVPTYVHVVTMADGFGNASALVPAQIDVLNQAFASAGFEFALRQVQVVRNDRWFLAEPASPEEIEMKAALRVGGPETLNIYTTNGGCCYLGWADFPHDAKRFPEYDGVVVWWATLPGTGLQFPADPALEPDGLITYDQGDTGTHEVGHWLGVYHTFEGGCHVNGDRIKDTPAEAAPQFFCAARDSCTAKRFPGLDPITNFMDYTDDVCMVEFTSDQERRMGKQWKAFRR